MVKSERVQPLWKAYYDHNDERRPTSVWCGPNEDYMRELLEPLDMAQGT